MKAWLVTWEWMGDSAAVADKVVGVFNPRWSSRRVAPLVELIYANATYSVGRMAHHAKRPGNNPYRSRIQPDQTIICGSHPYLHARRVEDLEVVEDPETYLETISWTELPTVVFSRENGSEQIGERRQKSFRRRRLGCVSHELVWDRAKNCFKPGWENYSLASFVEFERLHRVTVTPSE